VVGGFTSGCVGYAGGDGWKAMWMIKGNFASGLRGGWWVPANNLLSCSVMQNAWLEHCTRPILVTLRQKTKGIAVHASHEGTLSGGMAPPIFYHQQSGRVVSCMLRPLYPRESTPVPI